MTRRAARIITTRSLVSDPRNGAYTVRAAILSGGVLELVNFPVSLVDHWFPRRRSLTIYYDAQDRLQDYVIDSLWQKEKPEAPVPVR
jgi:hypothetical protein